MRELLSDFIDHSLHWRTARTLEAHLAACPPCRCYVATVERTIVLSMARQSAADRLDHLAQYDELTGLAKRALFAERHPGIVDRIDFGRHRRLSRAIDPNQVGLFD